MIFSVLGKVLPFHKHFILKGCHDIRNLLPISNATEYIPYLLLCSGSYPVLYECSAYRPNVPEITDVMHGMQEQCSRYSGFLLKTKKHHFPYLGFLPLRYSGIYLINTVKSMGFQLHIPLGSLRLWDEDPFCWTSHTVFLPLVLRNVTPFVKSDFTARILKI